MRSKRKALKTKPASILLMLVLTFLHAAAQAYQHPSRGAVARPVAAQEEPRQEQDKQQEKPQEGARAGEDEEARRRKEAFEIVWQTVKENYYDPTFGGLDWDKVREEFAPRAAHARTDRELHLLLQQMLNRLGQSHFSIILPEDIPAAEPDDEDDKDPLDANSKREDERDSADARGHKVTEQLTHGIGIDLRLLNGSAVITRVEPASSAALAGLRPGFIIRSIDGRSMRSILNILARLTVYQPEVKNEIPLEIVAAYINGPPGTSVRLSYLDGAGRVRAARIVRKRLRGEMTQPMQAMPAQYVEFESRRLAGGVGYIRFNVFAIPVMDKFCAALRSMRDAPGILIDLRGNRGGLLGMIYGMGGLLETAPISLGAMSTRGGQVEFRVVPQRHPYAGPLIILMDGMSMSASEMFAAGLQEAGRAIIVGEKSAGAMLPSTVKTLPTGAILQYAFADFRTASGKRLEGRGVVPDVAVRLERRALLGGHDSQLDEGLAQALRLTGAGEYARGLAPPLEPPPPRNNAAAPVIIRQSEQPPPPPVQKAQDESDAEIEPQEEKQGEDDKRPANLDATSPTVEQIIGKYERAVGGREAVLKLTTRVSKGRMEGSFAGNALGGEVEIIEKAPNKSITLINIPNLGVVRRGFTGAYGYEQVPLFGFREVKGMELAAMKLSLDFYWTINLRSLYPKMVLRGKQSIGGSDAYWIEATPADGYPTSLFFDTQTGLLRRKDGMDLEDYREVDGVLLPFTLRSQSTVIRLTEVKHNVPVEDSAFTERQDCFTR